MNLLGPKFTLFEIHFLMNIENIYKPYAQTAYY